MRFENTVINFHVIKNVDWMEKMLLIIQNHYRVITLNELEKFYYHNIDLKNACHITVDDGDLSVYTHLLPVIKKFQIPISIYVSPLCVKEGENFWFQEIQDFDLEKLLDFYGKEIGENITYLGKHQVYAILKSLKIEDVKKLISKFKKEYNIPDKMRMGINLEQLLELKETGLVDIGAHTYNHPILKNESHPVLEYEIKDCIEELSDMIKEKVKYFAFPNGVPDFDFSDREIRMLKNSGIKLAFTTENQRFSKNNDPLRIPRTGISKGNKSFITAKLAFGSNWENLKSIFNADKEIEYRKNLLIKKGVIEIQR
jgi:peptidoglycan/xylan/chitin deacetylase (PgdA/CDA1 family)